MDSSTEFKAFEEDVGVTKDSLKCLTKHGILTIGDFMILSKEQISELRTGADGLNLGQTNKLIAICSRYIANDLPPLDNSVPQVAGQAVPGNPGDTGIQGAVPVDSSIDALLAGMQRLQDQNVQHLQQQQRQTGYQQPQHGHQGLASHPPGANISHVRNNPLLDASGKMFDSMLFDRDSHRQDPLTPFPRSSDMPDQSTLNFAPITSHDDPRASLTVRNADTPVLDIRHFLSIETKNRLKEKRTNRLVQTGEQLGKLRGVAIMSDEELDYKGIRMGEWGEANMKLCFRLMQLGLLKDMQDTQDYMAYTSTIFSLGQRFYWENVMCYDQKYRVNQATLGFRWGTNVSMLDLSLLGSAIKTDNPNPKPNPKPNPNPKPKQLDIECKQFKAGNCTFGNKCRYKHVRDSSQATPHQHPPHTGTQESARSGNDSTGSSAGRGGGVPGWQ